jgi:hypothetical protein
MPPFQTPGWYRVFSRNQTIYLGGDKNAWIDGRTFRFDEIFITRMNIKMGKHKQSSKGSQGSILLLVLSLILLVFLTTGCKLIAGEPEPVPPTATETPSIDHDATSTAEEMKALEEQKAQTEAAELKMTEDANASATAEEEAAKAKVATEEANAAATEQAKLDATATELAKPTSTPTNTPLPTQTNTPPPPPPPPAVTGRIIRGPGEKAAGDHPVNINNKTGGNVTLIMDGDPFKYQFNVPDGNHKIYLRPGFFFYTVYLCGGQLTGSHQFNANWTWKLTCN